MTPDNKSIDEIAREYAKQKEIDRRVYTIENRKKFCIEDYTAGYAAGSTSKGQQGEGKGRTINPIRERLREFVKYNHGDFSIGNLSNYFKCPENSLYVPIRQLSREKLLKFFKGQKYIQIPFTNDQPKPKAEGVEAIDDKYAFLHWIFDNHFSRYWGSDLPNNDKWYKSYTMPDRQYYTDQELYTLFLNSKPTG